MNLANDSSSSSSASSTTTPSTKNNATNGITYGKASPMEKCGLMCHLFLMPIAFLYFLWVLVPEEQLQESWNIEYYPPKEWSIHIPLSIILLFFAAPILYAAMNSMTVPPLSSMDTIQDVYTRKPSTATTTTTSSSSPLPEICDLDPAHLIWYPSPVPSSSTTTTTNK